MALYRRNHSRIWWAEFWSANRRVRISTKETDKRKAALFVVELKHNLNMKRVGYSKPKAVPLFSDAMRAFLKWSESEHAAHPGTWRRYTTASKPLARYFKARPLDQVTAAMVENYKAHRASTVSPRTHRRVGNASINREISCAKAMVNFVLKSGATLPNGNPFRSGKHDPGAVRPLPEGARDYFVLSHTQEMQYLREASQPLKDVATLMLNLGCRPDEIYRAEKSWVNLDTRELKIPIGKTRAARRTLPLNDAAFDVLKRRVASAKGKNLFPHEKDKDRPMLKVNNAHDGAVERAGLEGLRLYDCRHVYATRCVQSGMDLPTLAGLLGHSGLSMVLRYAHPTAQHRVDATNRLADYVARESIAEFERVELAKKAASDTRLPQNRPQ